MDFSKIKSKKLIVCHRITTLSFFVFFMSIAYWSKLSLGECIFVAFPFGFASHMLSYAIFKIIDADVENREIRQELKSKSKNN